MGRGSLHFPRYTSITGSFRCVFFKTALTAWPSQMTAVLIRAHVGELFENLGKMCGVGISDHFPDISDLKAGICQQMLGLFNTQHIENIIEAFPGITVEQLRQVPLRDITGTRDLRQSQLFRIMLLHIGDCAFDKIMSGLLAAAAFLKIIGGQRAETLGHGGQSLLDFIQLGGLEQKACHAEADRLLRIAEIPVAGQYGYLHVRKL